MSKTAKQRPPPREAQNAGRRQYARTVAGWFKSLATFVIVGTALWAIYGRAIDAPFIYDDNDSILANSSITRLWPLVGDSQAPGPLNTAENSPTGGRPLVNLSLAINYRLGGLNPRGYHLVNLAVHLLSALLLAALVRRTLRLDYFGGRFDAAAWPLSVIVALIWAVHPLQTETVIYTTQRTELFAGFFYLATLYCSLRYWTVVEHSRRVAWGVLATLCCLAGAASKEIIATAPLVVLLFERTFLAGSLREALRRSWSLYLALAMSWLFLLALNYDLPRGNTSGFNQDLPAYAWWFTQAKILWLYLKLVVWPWPLVIHYGTSLLTTFGEAWPWLLLNTLLAGLTIVLIWRRSAFGFLAGAAWLILSPTLVVPVMTEVAAERRMYLPLACLVVMVVTGVYALVQRTVASPTSRSSGRLPTAALTAAAGIVVLVLSAVSVHRLSAYETEITIWNDSIERQADSPIARLNLGNVMLKEGRLPEALEQFELAIRLDPRFGDAYNNKAGVLRQLGRQQESLEVFEQAVQMQPTHANAQLNYGIALLEANRVSEAIDHLAVAAKLRPENAATQFNLGTALIRGERVPDAVDPLRQAVRLRPDDAVAHNHLGLALMYSGRVPEAVKEFERALQLNPDSAEAHFNLANALTSSSPSPEALNHYQTAMRLAQANGQTTLVEAIAEKLRTGTKPTASPAGSAPSTTP